MRCNPGFLLALVLVDETVQTERHGLETITYHALNWSTAV